MATELAKAYVQILPSMNGFKGELSRLMGSDADSAGHNAGLSMGGAFTSGFGAAAGAVSDITGELFELAGSGFESYIKGAVDSAVRITKYSIGTGRNFEKNMSQVAATMGVTVDEISELTEFAKLLGSETSFSASESSQALNYMALAGYDAETSMAMLPKVLDLAAAGCIDLAYASDMVTDSQSALGLTIDETSELVDKMAMASSKSNTSVSQLGEAILQIGGSAKKLKGGTTELSAVLGILADNGIKGASGGTALRNILNSLVSPTDDASIMLSKLGVAVYDSEGNMRSLNDIFIELRDSMNEMATQAERDQVVSTLFNARDMKSAEALLANVGERYDELSGYIDKAAGSAQTMADTQLDNLAGDVTLLKSNAEGAAIAFYDTLQPALRSTAQDFNGVIQPFFGMLSWDTYESSAVRFTAEFEGFMSRTAKVAANKSPDFIKAFNTVLISVGNSTVKSLPAFTRKILPAFTEGFNEVVSSACEQLPEAKPYLIEGAKTLFGGLVKSSGTVAQTVLPLIPDIIDAGIDFAIDEAAPALGKLGSGVVQNFPVFIDRLEDDFPRITSAVGGWIADAGENITEYAPFFIKGAIGLTGELVKNLPDIAVPLLDAGTDIIAGIPGLIADIIPEAVTSAQALGTSLLEIILPFDDDFKNAFNVSEEVKSFLDESDKVRKSIEENRQEREKNNDAIETEQQYVENLKKELYYLDDKQKITNTDIAKMTSIIEELNGILPDADIKIDTHTGHLITQHEEIEKLVNSYKSQIAIEAGNERLVEIRKDLWDIEEKTNKSHQAYLDAHKEFNKTEAEYIQVAKKVREERDKYGASTYALEQKEQALKEKALELFNAQGELYEAYAADNEMLQAVQAEYDNTAKKVMDFELELQKSEGTADTAVSSIVNSAGKLSAGLGSAAINAAESFNTSLLARTGYNISAVKQNIIGPMNTLPYEFSDIGDNCISSMISTMKMKANAAADAARNVGQSMVDAMKLTLRISSPSKVFAELGGFIPAGLAQGILANISPVGSAVSELAAYTEDEFGIRQAAALRSATNYTPAAMGSDSGSETALPDKWEFNLVISDVGTLARALVNPLDALNGQKTLLTEWGLADIW